MKRQLFTVLVCMTMFAVASCGEKKGKDKFEERIEKAKESVEDVVDDAKDQIEDKADEVGETLDKAKSKIEKAKKKLKKYLAENLAIYKIPREFHQMSTLPKTSTGKILKRALSRQGK